MDGEDAMKVEVYMERREHWKKDRKKERKEIEGRTLREESEQYYFLYKLSHLGSTCVEPDTHLLLNTNLILPCSCPRVEPTIVVLSLLTNFIDLGQIWKAQPIILSGPRLQTFWSLQQSLIIAKKQ